MNEIVPDIFTWAWFSEAQPPRRVEVGRRRMILVTHMPSELQAHEQSKFGGDRALRSECRGFVKLHWLQQIAGDAL